MKAFLDNKIMAVNLDGGGSYRIGYFTDRGIVLNGGMLQQRAPFKLNGSRIKIDGDTIDLRIEKGIREDVVIRTNKPGSSDDGWYIVDIAPDGIYRHSSISDDIGFPLTDIGELILEE